MLTGSGAGLVMLKHRGADRPRLLVSGQSSRERVRAHYHSSAARCARRDSHNCRFDFAGADRMGNASFDGARTGFRLAGDTRVLEEA